MLEILIPEQKDLFDSNTNEFLSVKETKLILEHSLLSLKKWEGRWKIPFLSTKLNQEQMIDYIRCMTVSKNVPDDVYRVIPMEELQKVADYISDKKTATTFSYSKMQEQAARRGEIVTAEIIYYWMITLNIPVEFQKWHLSQLLALIRVVSIKNSKDGGKRKLSAKERHDINLANRAKYHTKG